MNRSEQNEALGHLDELVNLASHLGRFQSDIQALILRNTFSSGQRKRKRGELGEMEGSPAPFHGDPTGETAVWDELSDKTTRDITNMAMLIRKFNVLAKDVLSRSVVDVEERAVRTIPDCLACGDPCVGRVLGGFDEKCWRRWDRSGRPDRLAFINETKLKRGMSTDENPNDDKDSEQSPPVSTSPIASMDPEGLGGTPTEELS